MRGCMRACVCPVDAEFRPVDCEDEVPLALAGLGGKGGREGGEVLWVATLAGGAGGAAAAAE